MPAFRIRLLAGALLASGALAAAPAAHASYVGVYQNGSSSSLLYYADFLLSDFGRDNWVGMSGGPPFTVTESTPGMYLALGPGCSRGSAGKYQAVCQNANRIEMFFGDGDDTGVTLVGSPGYARAFLYGENGDDNLAGGAREDDVHGGPGNDRLRGGGGYDQLYGEGGDDELIGGPGFDYANYDGYSTPVTVTLNGVADDGAWGEAGNADTEGVFGGSDGDVLSGNGDQNLVHGMAGDDVVEGGGGTDTLGGGPGDDSIWALDGVKDYIGCQDGYDQVLADRQDDVSRDCEAVSRP
jgi:hemolysin type calcium-binding protein